MNRQAHESHLQIDPTQRIDPKGYLPKVTDWTTGVIPVLAYREQLRSDGRPEGVWTGFSRFQAPVEILEYAGEPAAHLLLHLYLLGAGASNTASVGADVRFYRLVETLASGTGLSERKVERALARLRKDRHIDCRQGRKSDGDYGAEWIYFSILRLAGG